MLHLNFVFQAYMVQNKNLEGNITCPFDEMLCEKHREISLIFMKK